MKVFTIDCQEFFTVDTTLYTVDSTFITADRTLTQCALDGDIYFTFLFTPRFKFTNPDLEIILIREIENKVIDQTFTYYYDKNNIKVVFDSIDLVKEGRYSIEVRADDKILYLGKAIRTDKDPQDFEYTQRVNNKLYI